MRKTLTNCTAIASCAALLVTLLTGCSGGASPTQGSTTATPSGGDTGGGKKTTITLMVGNSGTLYPALQAVAAETEKRLNIAVKFDIKPDGTEGDNLVKTRLATGDMTDLLAYNSGSLLQALTPEENFADLSNESYMPNILDSFKTTVSGNGKIFGIPAGSSNVGAVLYNKKVYAELGLKIPKTWEEFMANSEKIKAAGKTAIIASYKTTWTSQLFVLGDFYNVQTQVPTFAKEYTANKVKYATTPAALRGFEKTQEPFKKGYYNKDFQSTTYDSALKMLADGTGVQYPMLTSAIDTINQNFPDKVNDIGVFPLPNDNESINGLTVWLPTAIYVNKKGKNVAAAKKWLEFFISADGQKIFASKSKASGPYVVKGVSLPEDTYQGVKDMQKYFDEGKTAPALEFVSPVKGPNLENLTIESGSGLKTPLEAAQAYDKDVQKQAQQLNLPGW